MTRQGNSLNIVHIQEKLIARRNANGENAKPINLGKRIHWYYEKEFIVRYW